MIEDFPELEAELRALRPRAATPALLRSIEKNLAASPVQFPSARPAPTRLHVFPIWCSCAAAAAIMMSFVLFNTPATAPDEDFAHFTGETLLAEEPLEIYALDDGTYVREIRQHVLTVEGWQDRRNQLTYARTDEREQFQTVALNIY